MKLFHYLLLLGLLARPGLLTRPGASCETRSLRLLQDRTSRYYPNSCVDVESLEDFAICLAQRNTFNKLLQCAYLPENEAWWARVPAGGFLDRMKNTRYELNFSPNDGKFRFTPKQLLDLIATGDECPGTHSNLGHSFRSCPFPNLGSYIQCLCCQLVEPVDLHNLRDECVYPSPFSSVKRYVSGPVLAAEPAIEFTCESTCPFTFPRDIPEERKVCPPGTVPNPSNSPFSSKVNCVWAVKDGVQQPLSSSTNLRRDGEFEFDYSSLFNEYPPWDATGPATTIPTRAVPTTLSRTYDFASESDDLLPTVLESEQETDNIVSHESTPTAADATPTAADTTPTAADTTSTGSDEPNVGAVFSSTDHIVLAFGLALVNLYHAMA